MADSANDVSTLSGFFKKQYHNQLEDLKPDFVILQKDNFIDWVPSDKMNGDLYHVPCVLKSNQGVTYLGDGGTVQDLAGAVNGVMKPAEIKGSELNVRGQLSYKAAAQALKGGERAFKSAAGWLVEDLAAVAAWRLEASALYGQSGLGIVSAVAEVTGQTATITLTEASFAPGIWALAENAFIDSFTTTTKNNTGTLQITSVDLVNRILNVTYSATAATLVSAPEVSISDVLYFKGSYGGSTTYNEMVGLYKQLTATTGTLFAIDRASYGLLQGNTYATTGNLSKAKIVDAVMLGVNKGLMSSVVVLVSTKAWAVLAAEEMALRMFDGSYSKETAQSGSKRFKYTSVNGDIEVICHPMVKYGEAFFFDPDEALWVGSIKGVTFELPGRGDEFFDFIPAKNGFELQCMADCALYVRKPGRGGVMTGITY